MPVHCWLSEIRLKKGLDKIIIVHYDDYDAQYN
jgi:hypothetical protein